MSNGSLSPDLGDMWHHGYLVSPQWEGRLELDSANDSDNGAMEKGMRDYISVTRKCSLWILIRDSLCSPDILSLRTAGRKWNNAELYGEHLTHWFFFMAKNEEAPFSPLPEWPKPVF